MFLPRWNGQPDSCTNLRRADNLVLAMTDCSPEIEAKLIAPSAQELLKLPEHIKALGFHISETRRFVCLDHYLDTPDLDIFRGGWALRLRDFSGTQLLTLKALSTPSVDGIAKREEIEQEVEWDGGVELDFDDGVLGGELTHLVQDKTLWQLFHIRQDRMQFDLVTEDGLNIEASMDQVRWEGQDAIDLGFEVELELKSGSEDDLRLLVQRLVERTDWQPATASKFVRGLGVAGLV
jgi:inorganic triphosphatase YgiF